MVKYYPERGFSVAKLNKMYPDWNLVDTEEVVRLNDIEEKKARGKGTPKKAKSKGASYMKDRTIISLTYDIPPADSRRTARRR